MYRNVRITSKILRSGGSVGNVERLVCCNGTGVYGREELSEGLQFTFRNRDCVLPRGHGFHLIPLPVWSGSRTVSVSVISPSFPTVH